MTLSWDTRYSTLDEDVAARPNFTTRSFVLAVTKFAAMVQSAVSRITKPSYTASNPARSFMESVFNSFSGMLFLRSSLS
jgi:hypothetical protein